LELDTSLPLSAAMQTIKLVHLFLRCEAAEFGCITPLLNGLSFYIREAVICRARFKFVRRFGKVLRLPCGRRHRKFFALGIHS
jgi:hypothetical protein